jgi:hypothetical protein
MLITLDVDLVAVLAPDDLRRAADRGCLAGVVPEGQRELWGRRDNGGEPDDGNDADQHVDDLGGRRARNHRASACAP